MSSYRYYDAGGGRHFCYAVAPTFLCPYGQLKVPTADEDWEVPEPFMQAAQALDVMPAALLGMVVRGHRNNRRLRVNGQLTDRCETCGHKMDRLGFRCWEETPKAPSGLDNVASRLGSAPPTDIVRTVYVDTKKEAREWAYEEMRIAKSVAKEG